MKNILIVIITMFTQICLSQNIEVQYSENKNFPKDKIAQLPPQVVAELSKEVKCKLSYSNNMSLFEFNNENTSVEFVKTQKRENYFKNFTVKKIQTLSDLDGEAFIVNDELPEIKWILKDEEKVFLGFKCTKAEADYKQFHLTAWFAKDIKCPDGPINITGLPGLILELNISDIIVYKALDVKLDIKDLKVNTFKDGKQISKIDFDVLKQKYIENYKQKQKEAGAYHTEIK